MAETTLFVHDLAAAVSPRGSGPLRGRDLGGLQVHSPASVAIAGDRVLAVGAPDEVLRDYPPRPDCETMDGRGKVALPGLVDCHAHPAFLGDRAAEFELRSGGASYEEIHASGGGILSTVEATRRGSEEELTAAVRRHLAWMLEHGTTTAEAKSGYGLDAETEIKSLKAITNAAKGSFIDVSPTFLGAHTVPPEFDTAAEYVGFVVRSALPEAATLARQADVFLERGSFEVPEARRYLEACREHGLAPRLHADQFSERGAIPLAIELGARSVDHLENTGDAGVRLLAKSNVAAVLLPACGLFLDLPLPPARRLADEGAILALATDFNPGSSFTESLPLAMNLACTRLGLSPAESLTACTANAAHVLDLPDVGRLAPGYKADVLVLDAPDWRYLAYHLGGDRFAATIKAGRLVS
ncbi:imidazolonepropionase [Rubrobacter tropicus]|uniref:Imidazolonepropionase n=1 Tax=Rubrobacter tropicus TaxID=2653851 RepID=A0A6G8Q7J2_9ACTN|nr:imidazolonepropionase [Rubrobacter tropicus]QIN82454.1 imidazolonepropionase [Rubrobacter tropicus]